MAKAFNRIAPPSIYEVSGMNSLSKASLAVMVCLMVACGGGGGDSTADTDASASADPVDKYVGHWLRQCEVLIPPSFDVSYPQGLSELEDVVVVKVNATAYETASIETSYHGIKCMGPEISRKNTQGAAQIHGTKTVAFGVVDKVVLNRYGVPLKMVTQVADGRLYITGATRPGITLDAEGYPNEVVPTAFAIPKTD